MPDLKISQLPAATTPLAGTELVPIVQSGVTDQTTIADILTSALPVAASTISATGATTLSSLTASTALALNASKQIVSVTNTGTGNNVLSASPTLTGTAVLENASFSGNATPAVDATSDIGTSVLRWRDGYFSSSVTAARIYAENIVNVGSFTWNSATNSPAAAVNIGASAITAVHAGIRRCVMSDAGVVQYYLDPNDSTKKADGSASVLTGADGQVMVEIPAFYTKRTVSGTFTTWYISPVAMPGFVLHPAFTKDGVDVPYRYIGAYDACVYDVTAAAYISGLNWDNNSSPAGVAVDVTASTGDKLASVSGVYPMVGLTRAEFRVLAANRGSGWRQADFWLIQAIQMLYLVEKQSFYSQNILGAGNTAGSYLAASGVQADSPHTIAGASNALGNGSTNTTSGAGVSAKPGTSYMSYRGIENFYGNCWNFVDGFNINNRQAYVSNTAANFADDTTTNYTALGTAMPSSDNYVTNGQNIDNAFLPASVGGSASTYWTDYYYQNTGWRVARFGGSADSGALAGAFYWVLYYVSSYRSRDFGARLAR